MPLLSFVSFRTFFAFLSVVVVVVNTIVTAQQPEQWWWAVALGTVGGFRNCSDAAYALRTVPAQCRKSKTRR